MAEGFPGCTACMGCSGSAERCFGKLLDRRVVCRQMPCTTKAVLCCGLHLPYLCCQRMERLCCEQAWFAEALGVPHLLSRLQCQWPGAAVMPTSAGR